MTEKNTLKKIRWFEKFTYQLLKEVNHSLFHRERESRLRRHKKINSALIKIFAYRLTYEDFGMIASTIRDVAHEITGPEIIRELGNLEKEKGIYPEDRDDEASDLINIILLLLREQAEAIIKEKEELEKKLAQEKKQEKKKKGEWFTAMPGGVLAFDGGGLPEGSSHAEHGNEDNEDKTDKRKNRPKEKTEDKETPPPSDSSLDNLLMNLGDKGLDDLIYGKKRRKDEDDKDEDDAWMGWID